MRAPQLKQTESKLVKMTAENQTLIPDVIVYVESGKAAGCGVTVQEHVITAVKARVHRQRETVLDHNWVKRQRDKT